MSYLWFSEQLGQSQKVICSLWKDSGVILSCHSLYRTAPVHSKTMAIFFIFVFFFLALIQTKFCWLKVVRYIKATPRTFVVETVWSGSALISTKAKYCCICFCIRLKVSSGPQEVSTSDRQAFAIKKKIYDTHRHLLVSFCYANHFPWPCLSISSFLAACQGFFLLFYKRDAF